MLPELLSSNLCSLRANELRYAFSVIWELDEDAEVKEMRFTKSLIRSRRAFTYEQAQIVHDDEKDVRFLSLALILFLAENDFRLQYLPKVFAA